jgi:hypothetical protein
MGSARFFLKAVLGMKVGSKMELRGLSLPEVQAGIRELKC